ncbi:MAG TPA: hypothetical protein VFC78_00795 [Tepidisphaeraceae bacterium]|nr:hypothetical protein [Tepidisphaeraceae bacterium]
MADLQIHRFYETCLKRQATEAWLVAGQPPLLRIEGHLHKLEIPPLSPADVETALHKLAAPKQLEFYREHGFLDFGSSYAGGQILFDITMLNHSGQCLGHFRVTSREAVPGTTPGHPFKASARAEP